MALAEISAALTATSGAINLLKTLSGASKQAEINRVILELQGQLIDLQAKILSVQGEFDQLNLDKKRTDKELEAEKAKSDDRSNYVLEKATGGGHVYAYTGKTEPKHMLCAACFNSSIKSILQVYDTRTGRSYVCHNDKEHCFYG